ncbi:hypothetical protein B0H14DRAFT_3737686 [Mycena olivaceomarginata]|nr:hypothetical protein B0H14DRAFT_3737686 [Mycena olivaceomarginata]
MVSGTGSADSGSPAAPLHKRHSTSNFTTPEPSPTPPPRPPRNPARAGAAEPKPKAQKRPSTATGAREEVTPWEFFPVNAPTEGLPAFTSEETAKQSSATATGKREDVLPWELFPAPDYDASLAAAASKSAINNGSHLRTNHTRSPRHSISSSSILPDMVLLRRRKSTNAKPASPLHANASPRPSTSTITKSPAASPKVLYKTPSASTMRPPLPARASSGPVSTISSVSTITPDRHLHPPGHDPKFSTADRTILQELKRNINARAAQFVIKGGPESGLRRAASITSRGAGSKHHAYARDEVPYPRSYAREVLDLDVWETMACQRLCDSLTFHVFTTPPTKVLDIGCWWRTGTWILNCGMAWKKCHFVGLDVVPLHPDLGASELSTRITWVQANFLEGLPFPNEEFDFVHIKRIALGVPEDKWDALFEEVGRVLKSGGAFELIEEDLFFPGKTLTDDDDSDSDAVSELRYAHNDSASDGNDDDESVITGTGSGGSRVSYDGSAPTPNTSLSGAAGTPPRTASPLPMIESLIQEEIEEPAEEPTSQRAPVKKPSLGTGHPPHHRHSYQPRVPSVSHPASGSTSSLLASLGPGVVPVSPMVDRSRSKPRGYSTSVLASPPPNQHPSVLSLKPTHSGGDGTAKPAFSPFLLRTLPKAPPNPRDHSILEGIYNEMNATRFINLSPLSLLANLVGLHFRDVRTHPPLQLTFPPPVAKPATFSDGSTLAEEPRWLNTKDLLKRESRYISLDESRRSAYSPAARSSFPAMSPPMPVSGLPAVDTSEFSLAGVSPPPAPKLLPIYRTPESQNRLPNNTFNIDVRTLNMHLALRVAEVVACAESMWEWVVSYQAVSRPTAGRPRAGSLASELPPRASRVVLRPDPSTDAFKNAVLDLTREDFDDLLVKFELDMRDHMAIGSVLRDQFSWPSIPITPSQDRKAFHAACERWEQWQDHQRRKVLSPYGRHQARNSVDSPYVHVHEGSGIADRPGGPKPDVARGRSSLTRPESVPPVSLLTKEVEVQQPIQSTARPAIEPLHARFRRLETLTLTPYAPMSIIVPLAIPSQAGSLFWRLPLPSNALFADA